MRFLEALRVHEHESISDILSNLISEDFLLHEFPLQQGLPPMFGSKEVKKHIYASLQDHTAQPYIKATVKEERVSALSRDGGPIPLKPILPFNSNRDDKPWRYKVGPLRSLCGGTWGPHLELELITFITLLITRRGPPCMFLYQISKETNSLKKGCSSYHICHHLHHDF